MSSKIYELYALVGVNIKVEKHSAVGMSEINMPYVYPIFSAEKQLEIIKVIGLLGNVCITKREYNGFWCITTHHKNGMGEHESFDEALAMLIYNIWNYLSEPIQRKIKGVLNDF